MKEKNWLLPLCLALALGMLIPYWIGQRTGFSPFGNSQVVAEKEKDAEMLAYLKSVSFPLYDSEYREICTGFNIAGNEKNNFALYSAAGHCSSANKIHVGRMMWHASPLATVVERYQADLFIGVKPFCPSVEKIASFPVESVVLAVETLRVGNIYYTLGQNGDRDANGIAIRKLVKLIYQGNDPKRGLFFSLAISPGDVRPDISCDGAGCGFRIKGRVSGSPILDLHKKVVGVVRGFEATEAAYEVFATDANELRRELEPLMEREIKMDIFHPSVCKGALPAFSDELPTKREEKMVGPTEPVFVPSAEFIRAMDTVGFCAKTKEINEAVKATGEAFEGKGNDKGVNEQFAVFQTAPVISLSVHPETHRWRLLLARGSVTCVAAVGGNWEKLHSKKSLDNFVWEHPYKKHIGKCATIADYEQKLFVAFGERHVGKGTSDPFPESFGVKESHVHFFLNDGGSWSIVTEMAYNNGLNRACLETYGAEWVFNDYYNRY